MGAVPQLAAGDEIGLEGAPQELTAQRRVEESVVSHGSLGFWLPWQSAWVCRGGGTREKKANTLLRAVTIRGTTRAVARVSTDLDLPIFSSC